jgi:hypothetical protein
VPTDQRKHSHRKGNPERVLYARPAHSQRLRPTLHHNSLALADASNAVLVSTNPPRRNDRIRALECGSVNQRGNPREM